MDVIRNALCDIADILQVKLKWDEQNSKITLAHKHTIHLAGLSFNLFLSCVSTRIFGNRFFAIIPVKGNLAFLLDVPVGRSSYPAMLHFLNLGKMENPKNFLENMEDISAESCVKAIFPAIARSFYFDNQLTKWQPITRNDEHQV